MGLIEYLNNRGQRNPLAAGNANLLTNPEIVSIGADEVARALAQQGGATTGVGPASQQQTPRVAPVQVALSGNSNFLTTPEIVSIDADEAARALAQQSGATTGIGPAPQQQPAPPTFNPMNLSPYSFSQTPVGPAQAPESWLVAGAGENPAQPNGLLGMLQRRPPAAAQSTDSGGLLQRLGVTFPNLSPAASQALLASGLTMLSGNDGSRNLGQLIGIGGLAGLNTYGAAQQRTAANNLALRKMAQEADWRAKASQQADRKQMWDENKPIAVGADQTLYAPDPNQLGAYKPIIQAQPSVASWQETQGPDGMKYRQGFTRAGEPVRDARVLVDNPYAGPLSDFQQKNVNDLQTAASTAAQTYQQTANLAHQLANSEDWSAIGQTATDWWHKVSGGSNDITQLRRQLAQFANSTVLDQLPPGSASDKDVELVRAGIPSDRDDKATWQAYLDAVGRVQQGAAVGAAIKAEFAAGNRGSFAPLMQSATIGGRTFPAGTSIQQVLNAGGSSAGPALQPNQSGTTLSPFGHDIRAELGRRKGKR